jgi:23S rRNA-/tRNA-specific pseudouridylate synthase
MKKNPRKGGPRIGKQGRRGPRASGELVTLYEDDAVVALNKPPKLLAVPTDVSDAPSALSLLSA